MSKKLLLKGNEALAEAAIRAGCKAYFGYPITPQNEVPAYMSRRMPESGGVFVQAESELAAINMLFGAGATGTRAMTSSSSPGISLMQEGISYIAGAETPGVIVNMMRGGPGLGNIAPSQADYLQSVKGGGHGDYQLLVIAPSSVQELVDLTVEAFDKTMQYRIPVMILGDGILGQMSEAVVLPDFKTCEDQIDWAIANNSDKQVVIKSLHLSPENSLELHNHSLQEKYKKISNEYTRFEQFNMHESDYLIVAYGSVSRICKAAINLLQKDGINTELFRPITLWPFPSDALLNASKHKKKIFVIEMAHNQLQQDVALSVSEKTPISAFNKLGGAIFNEEEIAEFILRNQ